MTPRFDFERIRPQLPGGDALLILPPFAGFERPSLGLHVLEAVARNASLKVDIFNANIHFASCFGEDKYTGVCYAVTGVLSGEKVFAPVAFPGEVPTLCDPDVAAFAADWVRDLAAFIATLDYPVIGCNTMFEQLTCSVAILSAVKNIAPEKTTIIGGAQCEGEMGIGILGLGKGIDFVFSGESEASFVKFLRAPAVERSAGGRIVQGTPLIDMEGLPAVDYSSYFAQFGLWCPDSDITREGLHWLPMEGSRGCWWGQKHHCTFCGINGTGMAYRMKSSEKLLGEIKDQFGSTRCGNILMVDNIMPHEYFQDLLPDLAEEDLGLRIFYEQKANLTARRMETIRAAGINIIQPGIESLSDELLVLMKKGVKSWQNINALRHARMCDVYVNWNLLHSFPHDRKEHYQSMAELIPFLHHLCPPSGLCKLSIDRFSPYFDQRSTYGITNVRPMESYHDIFPNHADIDKLAYHFLGDYESAALNDETALTELTGLVEQWISSWEDRKAPPVLSISKVDSDVFLVTDTRSMADRRFEFIDEETALAALFGSHVGSSDALELCIRRGYCVRIGSVIAPLATTNLRLFKELCGGDIAERPQEQLASRGLDYAFDAGRLVNG